MAAADQSVRPFRVHERRPIKLTVGIVHPTEAWEGEAKVQNIGLGGAGLEMPGNGVRSGDRVVLYFTAPNLWDPLEIAAKVAWVRPATRVTPSQFGVAFEPADAPRVLALYDFIAGFAFER